MTAISIKDSEKAFIEEQVKSGRYKNADAVVHAGLQLLRQKESKLDTLRALIQEGLDDIADGRVVSFENEGELADYIIREAAEKKN